MSPKWRKGTPNEVFNWFLLAGFNFLTLEVPTVTTNLDRLAGRQRLLHHFAHLRSCPKGNDPIEFIFGCNCPSVITHQSFIALLPTDERLTEPLFNLHSRV